MAGSKSNADRQLEEAIGGIFKFIGKIIVFFFKSLFRGIKKLNRKEPWIGFGIAILIAISTICLKDLFRGIEPLYVGRGIYICLLCTPVLYLFILGGSQSKLQKKYEKIFKDIGYVGKDKKYPFFCGVHADGKKKILVFKSNIPLADWKAAKERLETAIDCTILKMESGNSKKIVKLTVLPPEYKIPPKITWDDAYLNLRDGVIVIGESALDRVSFDLNNSPHVLAAGETGSGKSVILRCIWWQMVLKGSRVYMIDFKGGVEFGKKYEKYGEVITEYERVIEVLELLIKENERRLKLFREIEVKNLYEYNKKTHHNLCRIGLFVDELAQMLDKKGVSKDKKKVLEVIEGHLSTLARLARATGINLIVGVQRPDANVLPGQIKNNIPVRISGRFADKAVSEIVLGNTDAVDLPNIKGRFLYKVGNETIEFQSYFFKDEKISRDVNVKVGNMLVEMPERYEELTQPEERTVVKKELSEAQKRQLQSMSIPLDSTNIEIDLDDEPSEFGLNLNYWEDER